MDYVSTFYTDKKEKNTIENNACVIAALVLERPEDESKFEMALFTTGTKFKRKHCTVLEQDNHWDICDGHAEAMCYQLASIYLLKEILKVQDSPNESIFHLINNEYELKRDMKFHLFVSHPPCGFMTKRELPWLSWKHFERKPFILECSSKILIGTYLGIQGPLICLLSKPIYISSVVIMNTKNKACSSTEIVNRMKKFVSKVNTNKETTLDKQDISHIHQQHELLLKNQKEMLEILNTMKEQDDVMSTRWDTYLKLLSHSKEILEKLTNKVDKSYNGIMPSVAVVPLKEDETARKFPSLNFDTDEDTRTKETKIFIPNCYINVTVDINHVESTKVLLNTFHEYIKAEHISQLLKNSKQQISLFKNAVERASLALNIPECIVPLKDENAQHFMECSVDLIENQVISFYLTNQLKKSNNAIDLSLHKSVRNSLDIKSSADTYDKSKADEVLVNFNACKESMNKAMKKWFLFHEIYKSCKLLTDIDCNIAKCIEIMNKFVECS